MKIPSTSQTHQKHPNHVWLRLSVSPPLLLGKSGMAAAKLLQSGSARSQSPPFMAPVWWPFACQRQSRQKMTTAICWALAGIFWPLGQFRIGGPGSSRQQVSRDWLHNSVCICTFFKNVNFMILWFLFMHLCVLFTAFVLTSKCAYHCADHEKDWKGMYIEIHLQIEHPYVYVYVYVCIHIQFARFLVQWCVVFFSLVPWFSRSTQGSSRRFRLDPLCSGCEICWAGAAPLRWPFFLLHMCGLYNVMYCIVMYSNVMYSNVM